MRTYTIEVWKQESLNKQSVLVVKVNAETESDALGKLKQYLLDSGMTPKEVTDKTYYAIISEHYNACNGDYLS